MLASFLTSQGSAYFNSFEMRVLESEQICERILRAWSIVTARYEILRTGFTSVDDPQHPFAMLTYQPDVFKVRFETQVASSDDKICLRERTESISKAVLRSLHQPPWRIEVIIKKRHFCSLRVFIHHALFDAHSIMLILRDVEKCYLEENLSSSPSINSLLTSIILENHCNMGLKKSFWQGSLEKSAIGAFPNTSPVKVRLPRTYSSEIYCATPLSEIQARCRNIGVTIQAAGQASWARVLSSYIGETSVIFGTGVLHCHFGERLLNFTSFVWTS